MFSGQNRKRKEVIAHLSEKLLQTLPGKNVCFCSVRLRTISSWSGHRFNNPDPELVFSGCFAIQVSRPVLDLNHRKSQKSHGQDRTEPHTFSQKERKIIRVRTDDEPAHQHFKVY